MCDTTVAGLAAQRDNVLASKLPCVAKTLAIDPPFNNYVNSSKNYGNITVM